MAPERGGPGEGGDRGAPRGGEQAPCPRAEHPGEHPSAALAYAIRSLELADTREGRLAAVRAIQQGPTAFVWDAYKDNRLDVQVPSFSASGERLAIGGFSGVQVLGREGGPPVHLERFPNRGLGSGGFVAAELDAGGRVLVTLRGENVRAFSIPERRELWSGRIGEGPSWPLMRDEALFTVEGVDAGGGKRRWLLRRWDVASGRSQLVGASEGPGNVDPAGRLYAFQVGRRVLLRPLDRWDASRVLGEHAADVEFLVLDPAGQAVAARDASGEVLLWPTGGASTRTSPALSLGRNGGALAFDPSGRWLLGTANERGRAVGYLRDRLAPFSTRPLALRRQSSGWSGVDFHPGGRWLATTHQSQVTLWWLGGPWGRVYESQGPIQAFAFAPDGAILAGTLDGALRRWPVTPEHGEPRVVLKVDQPLFTVEIAPDRRHALLAAWHRVLSVPLEGGAPREVAAFSPNANLVAFALAPDGRRLVAAPLHAPTEERVLREWNLATDGRVSWRRFPDRTARPRERSGAWPSWTTRASSRASTPGGSSPSTSREARTAWCARRSTGPWS